MNVANFARKRISSDCAVPIPHFLSLCPLCVTVLCWFNRTNHWLWETLRTWSLLRVENRNIKESEFLYETEIQLRNHFLCVLYAWWILNNQLKQGKVLTSEFPKVNRVVVGEVGSVNSENSLSQRIKRKQKTDRHNGGFNVERFLWKNARNQNAATYRHRCWVSKFWKRERELCVHCTLYSVCLLIVSSSIYGWWFDGRVSRLLCLSTILYRRLQQFWSFARGPSWARLSSTLCHSHSSTQMSLTHIALSIFCVSRFHSTKSYDSE